MSAPAGRSVLARNTTYAFLGYAVAFVLPVLVTPYLLDRLGRDAFGVLAALGTVGLWLGRTDFGIWAALPREVADRRAREDRAGLESLATTWFVIDLLFAAILMGAVLAAGRAILSCLLPGSSVKDLYPALVAIALQSVLSPFLRHLMGSLEGMQRLDLVNKVTLVVTPLQIVGLAVFLERGWGMFGVALNGVIFSVLQIAIFAILLVRTGYPLTFEPGAYSAATLKRLVGFGWKLEANQILLQGFRSDRLILSVTGLPVALVGLYQIGANVADRLGSAVQTLSSAVLPAASDLAARGERERIVTLLMRGTKYPALAVTGLLGFGFLFGPELITAWMGRSMPEAVAVLRWMSAGVAAMAVASCSQAVAAALGRPGLIPRGTMAGLAGAVVLYMTLGRRYDYRGLAGSISAGMVLAQAVFMIGFHGMLEFRWREWVGNAFLKPLAVGVPLLAVYGAWHLAAPHLPPVSGRIPAIALLAPAFALSAGLAWLLARALKVVDDLDLDVLKSLVRPPSA